MPTSINNKANDQSVFRINDLVNVFRQLSIAVPVNLFAMIWGFAEATLFFIVPDVWLTIVGRDKLKCGLIACLYSLGGALVGGMVIYYCSSHYPVIVLSAMEMIPGISSAMIDSVQNDLDASGVMAVLLGPLTGTPYKLYAAKAYIEGVSLWQFMLMSVPARLIRFVLVTILSHLIVNKAVKIFPSLSKLWLILIAWVIFYIFYFVVI